MSDIRDVQVLKNDGLDKQQDVYSVADEWMIINLSDTVKEDEFEILSKEEIDGDYLICEEKKSNTVPYMCCCTLCNVDREAGNQSRSCDGQYSLYGQCDKYLGKMGKQSGQRKTRRLMMNKTIEWNIITSIMETKLQTSLCIFGVLNRVVNLIARPPHARVPTPNYTHLRVQLNTNMHVIVFNVSTALAAKIFLQTLICDKLDSFINGIMQMCSIMTNVIAERCPPNVIIDRVHKWIQKRKMVNMQDDLKEEYFKQMGVRVNTFDTDLVFTKPRKQKLKSFMCNIQLETLLFLSEYSHALLLTSEEVKCAKV